VLSADGAVDEVGDLAQRAVFAQTKLFGTGRQLELLLQLAEQLHLFCRVDAELGFERDVFGEDFGWILHGLREQLHDVLLQLFARQGRR